MAFFTRVFAFSQVVPPSLSSDGRAAPEVLLNEVQPLHRDEELVLAGIVELHELLSLETDFDPLQTHEYADAVIDVDNQVTRLQIAEIGEKRPCRRTPPLVDLPLFLENVGLGPDLQRRVREAEAAGQVTGSHQD